MAIAKYVNNFFNNEKAGGIVLVLVTIISLLLANSAWQEGYIDFWHFDIAGETFTHWINDGLMTIFFLLIGLELEREIYIGQLSSLKKATLPLFAALGGILIPAGIFLALNYGTDTQPGAGIPMATDIAFAIGVLSLLGSRVPVSLKVFLTALAVMDDLGAILVIAIFYTSTFSFLNLMISLGVFGFLLFLNRMKVNNIIPYLIGGVVMWYFMYHSGIHAAITGVLLAFTIPFNKGSTESPSYKLEHFLYKGVAFIILPLFAMANTSISIGEGWHEGLTHINSLGIILGLVIGKPLGIWLFSYIGAKMGLCALPDDLQWSNIVGAGLLGGIGFTMSIFITLLAFDDLEHINESKIAIIIASILAGSAGYFYLKYSFRKKKIESTLELGEQSE